MKKDVYKHNGVPKNFSY